MTDLERIQLIEETLGFKLNCVIQLTKKVF